jgi:anthranilate synthase component II
LKILLIDNYDSFTYNLAHYFENLDCEVKVVRNDAVNLESLQLFDKLVLSPGPGLPKDANQLMKVIEFAVGKMPVFGVCLGFQAIVEHFKGTLFNQEEVKHGISEACVFQNNSKLFQDLPINFEVGLYHSWGANEKDFPENLRITARTEKNVIMAFEDNALAVCGVQFHPESILTDHGIKIVENFIQNFN